MCEGGQNQLWAARFRERRGVDRRVAIAAPSSVGPLPSEQVVHPTGRTLAFEAQKVRRPDRHSLLRDAAAEPALPPGRTVRLSATSRFLASNSAMEMESRPRSGTRSRRDARASSPGGYPRSTRCSRTHGSPWQADYTRRALPHRLMTPAGAGRVHTPRQERISSRSRVMAREPGPSSDSSTRALPRTEGSVEQRSLATGWRWSFPPTIQPSREASPSDGSCAVAGQAERGRLERRDRRCREGGERPVERAREPSDGRPTYAGRRNQSCISLVGSNPSRA